MNNMKFFRTKAYLVSEDTVAGLAKDLKNHMNESPLLHNSFSPDVHTNTENGETYVAFSMKKTGAVAVHGYESVPADYSGFAASAA